MFDVLQSTNLALVPDTVTGTDPLGLGIEATVKRIDHPEWIAYQKESQGGARVLDAINSQHFRDAMARAAAKTAGRPSTAQRGVRLPKKLTRRQEAAGAGLSQDAIREALLDVDFDFSSMMKRATEDELETLKVGLARFGVESWSVTEGGESVPATPANILRFLGWHGSAAVEQSTGKLGRMVPGDAGAAISCDEGWEIQRFTPHRDAAGRLVCFRESPYRDSDDDDGSGTFGDVVTLWLIDLAASGKLDADQSERGAVDFFGVTPGGAGESSGG